MSRTVYWALAVASVSISYQACSLWFDARDLANAYDPAKSDGGAPGDAGQTARILAFSIAPQTISRGGTAVLRWETELGTAIEISESGTSKFSSSDPLQVARGFLLVEPNESVTYTFTLRGGDGDPDSRAQSLLVLSPAVEPPAIARFDASPRTFPEGQVPPFDVTLDWSTSAADRIELAYLGEKHDVLATASEVASVGGTTELELTAANARGSIFAVNKVWTTADEMEPNDDATLAVFTEGVARRGVLDRPVGGDWFHVRLPSDGYGIAANVDGLQRSCHPSARVSLYQAGGLLLGSAGGEPLSLCPAIDPRKRTFARTLAAGDYYVVVEATDSSMANDPAYLLFVSALPRRVGNGVIDYGEDCDDGDRVVDDGCDDAGLFEPGYAYVMQPGRAGRIAPDTATKLDFVSYSSEQARTGVGYAVVPLDYLFPFFGSNYAALIVHSSGLVTFSLKTTADRPDAGRPFPDPSLGAAAIALFAGDLEGGEGVTWTSEIEGERWTSIELRDVTGRLPPGRDAFSISGRVSISESGMVELEYLSSAASPGVDPPLAVGIQDVRGRIGHGVPSCADVCSLSRLPSPPSVVRFSPK